MKTIIILFGSEYLQKLSKFVFLPCFILSSMGLLAQEVVINGPTTVNQNDYSTYVVHGISGVIDYDWYVAIAQMLSEDETSVYVRWTSVGNQRIFYDAETDYNLYYGELTVNVQVPPPPPCPSVVPVTSEPTVISETSFSFDLADFVYQDCGGLDSNGDFNYTHLLYVSTNENFSNPVINGVDIGISFPHVVNGLSACGTYFYRTRLYGSEGYSDWSPTRRVDLLGSESIDPRVSRSRVQSCRYSELKWNSVACAQSYQIQYAEDVTFWNIILDTNHSDTDAWLGEFDPAYPSGITDYCTWFVRIRAKNGSTYGPWSVTKELGYTPKRASGLNATNISEHSFTANWNELPCADYYVLDISRFVDGSYYDRQSYDVYGTSYTFNNLIDGEEYFYRVAGRNSFQVGCHSFRYVTLPSSSSRIIDSEDSIDVAVVENIKLYPNPANNYFKIEILETKSVQKMNWELFDQSGRKLLNGSIASDSNSAQIPANALSNGLFYLKLFRGGKLIETRRLVVRH